MVSLFDAQQVINSLFSSLSYPGYSSGLNEQLTNSLQHHVFLCSGNQLAQLNLCDTRNKGGGL